MPHPKFLFLRYPELTSRDITEAMAYERIDPWDEQRADLRAGIVASVFANAFRKKGSKPVKPEDMMPKFGQSRPTQTVEEQLSIIGRIREALRERKRPRKTKKKDAQQGGVGRGDDRELGG